MGRVDSFIKFEQNLMAEKEEYYSHVQQGLTIFTEEEQLRLSLRFIYNSIQNSNGIVNSLTQVKEEFDALQKAANFQQIKERFNLIKREIERVLKLLKDDEVLLSDIKGRLRVEQLQNEFNKFKKYLLDKSKLETGDILLSLKSKKYFMTHFLAFIVSKFTSSQVTHAMICVKISQDDIRMVDSRTKPYFYRLHKLRFNPKEIVIVMRPKISYEQRALLLRSIRNFLEKKTRFSIKKLAGVFPGTLLTKWRNRHNKGYTQVPNITSDSDVFCSEFVNEVFKDAGLLLTPKSGYSGMVFSADILRSPYLSYIGILVDESVKSEATIKKYLVPSKI